MNLNYLKDTYRDAKISFRHNPHQFVSNSFEVSEIDGKLEITATLKKKSAKKGKCFKVVGYIYV